MEDIIFCTASNCPYQDNCERYFINHTSTTNEKEKASCFNYEYYCNENNGFDCYIKK